MFLITESLEWDYRFFFFFFAVGNDSMMGALGT